MTTPPAAPDQPLAPAEPAEPAKKKGGWGKKILGVVVAIVVALAVKFGIGYISGDIPVHAEAGDCVTVTGPDNDPTVETQDCSAQKADLYKVVKVVDGTFDVEKCGDSGEVFLAQQWDQEKFVLCMNPVKN
ncbi:hypothetical protein ACIQNK_39355 [Streptomyces sp. NPDC091273]|uniref:LppU/SCO3897 family protein n=1 Tax=Streptomyces sp. NPDC091273 TaxID=3365982 RepID=UPI00381B8D36